MFDPSVLASPLSENPPTSRSFLQGTEAHASPQRVQVQSPPPCSRPLPPKVEQRAERVLLEDAVTPSDVAAAHSKEASLVFSILRCMKDDELRIPGAGRLILLAYSMYANPDDEAWPAVETIAKFTGMSERAAREMISKLADLGWLEHVDSWKGGRLTARYLVRLNGKDFSTWTPALHEARLKDLEARQAIRPSSRRATSSRTVPTPRPMPVPSPVKVAKAHTTATSPTAIEGPPVIPAPIHPHAAPTGTGAPKVASTKSAALGCEICPPGGRNLPPWDAKSAADRSGMDLRPTDRSQEKGREEARKPGMCARAEGDHLSPTVQGKASSYPRQPPIQEASQETGPDTSRCPVSPARASKPISKPSWIPEPTEPSAHTASPEDLLSWVAQYPCLGLLLQDPTTAQRWAEDQSGIFAMSATRGEDVFNAIRSFVAGNSEAARDMQRLQLVKALGTYLSNAKKFGDSERARKAKEGDRSKPSDRLTGGGSNRNKYVNPRDVRQSHAGVGVGARMGFKKA